MLELGVTSLLSGALSFSKVTKAKTGKTGIALLLRTVEAVMQHYQ